MIFKILKLSFAAREMSIVFIFKNSFVIKIYAANGISLKNEEKCQVFLCGK
jgi:hypothetical protein